MIYTRSLVSEEEVHSKSMCYHCGEDCKDEIIPFDNHTFCCHGCLTVYELLKENDLCTYYSIDGPQGNSPDQSFFIGKFDYLNLPDVSEKLLEFTDGRLSQVSFYLPKMHCSSCIWLLEQLCRFNPAIRSSTVNFPEKKVRIIFDTSGIRLSSVAELTTRIGYEPYISLNDMEGTKINKWNRKRLYKIGVSGFCFGNIMMLSFPEYFSLGQNTPDPGLRMVFDFLNLALSLPVLFYCAADFFKSAWTAVKSRYLNIDAPLSLAMLSVFSTSLYQILSHTGPGYFDSFTGAVFFLLIGRYFQDKTYAGISFDRDYKSYFPVAVSLLKDSQEFQKPIKDLRKGDILLIRNEELIPTDTTLLSARALIDYSFVSGEADPVARVKGDTIYAGGKQKGESIQMEVLRQVSQSYLTQLWNNDTFTREKEDSHKTLAARINRYFSTTVLAIALTTFLFWFFVKNQPETAFLGFTTCLLVACPCALLLSSTFTSGNLVALLGKNQFYPKNADTVERLSRIDTIVFDKTGTITLTKNAGLSFVGPQLTPEELVMAKTLAMQSSHPLSRALTEQLINVKASRRALPDYHEISGSGIKAMWGSNEIKLGSSKWVGCGATSENTGEASRVYFSIQDNVRGYFYMESKYRPNLAETVSLLQSRGYDTYLLSGDKSTDREFLATIFGKDSNLFFEQTPEQKLSFVRKLQKEQGKNVLMVGDGLNDAGALSQSNVGLAVTDDVNNFSPACDAIVAGNRLSELPAYINLARSGQRIIKISFAISLIYNILGLSFAVTGQLSPVVAAILMPLSSITIVGFTTLATGLATMRLLKN